MIKLTDMKVPAELRMEGLKQEISKVVCLPISRKN